jgi:hypothetical protein
LLAAVPKPFNKYRPKENNENQISADDEAPPEMRMIAHELRS